VSHTYTNLNLHLVFATKHRQRLISPEMETRLWAYLAGIAKQHNLHPHQIGGVEDHIHMALSCPPTIAVSKIAQLMKGNSSKWIHDSYSHLRDFAWQEGYGAFSVSCSNLPRVITYISNQRAHHETQSFDEEFQLLLEKHGLIFDQSQTSDE
jgi:putative transposase